MVSSTAPQNRQNENVNVFGPNEPSTKAPFSTDINDAPRAPKAMMMTQLTERKDPRTTIQLSAAFDPLRLINTQAQQQNESFMKALTNRNRDLMLHSRFAHDWNGSNIGWDARTGLPKYAVVIASGKAHALLCGPQGAFIKGIRVAWPKEFKTDYVYLRESKLS